MTPASTIPEPEIHESTASAANPEDKPGCAGRPRTLSPRQLEANRRNARQSTGPRTETGKAISCLNARRHDITGQVSVLPDPEHAAVEAFCRPIVDSFAPGSAHEIQLARHIAEAHWRLNRVRAVEDNNFALHIARFPDHPMAGQNPHIAYALHQAKALSESAADFNLLSLYEQRIQRAMAKNIQLFNEARQQRLAAEAEARTAQATAFEEAQLLRQLATAKGEDFDVESEAKANNGFLYSLEQLDLAIARQTRLRDARAALTPPKNRLDPARLSLAALLRQAA